MPSLDSPLAAVFVAAPDHWSRNGSLIRAVVCHMAEGAGTVPWLTRDDGNSSHYVIELSGRIVQMVAEARAAGSLNPTLTRTTNDAAFTFEGESVRYGVSVLRASLGTAGVADPNRCVIAIETEGFAKPLTATQKSRFPKANPAGGPNAAQRKALKALINDIRRRHGALPVIGHRDQQSYKACPGHAFPWKDYGGHGVRQGYVAPPVVVTPPDPTTGDDMAMKVPAKPLVAVIAQGAWIYDNADCTTSSGNLQISPGPRKMPVAGKLTTGVLVIGYVDSTPVEAELPAYYAKAGTPTEAVVVAAPPPVQLPPVQIPPDATACKSFADAATVAERNRIALKEADRIRNT